ncbi:MAG: M15 family metallopeptidase [Nocardioidaceae bacterium]
MSPSKASTPTPEGSPTKTPTARTRVRLDHWSVGTRPLPLRADGFGEVLPTPRVLRVRRMQAADVLPPPTDGRFRGTVGPVTPEIRRRMGKTWSPSCPVALSGLRYLTLTFAGFDGRSRTGELVVNASVSRGVVGVFRTLYAARFPIEEMRLVTSAGLDAPATGDGNNTAAYVCRPTRRATTFSAHASGLAIDLNPFVNPYRSGDLVLPELAGAYEDRSWRRPGMVLPGGVATRAFGAAGWTWGGDFRTVSDLMHFSANGR